MSFVQIFFVKMDHRKDTPQSMASSPDVHKDGEEKIQDSCKRLSFFFFVLDINSLGWKTVSLGRPWFYQWTTQNTCNSKSDIYWPV